MAEQSSIPPSPPGASAPPPFRGPQEDTILLVLCYIGLLALIPYLIGREEHVIRWHARQGLALGIVGVGSAALVRVPYLGFIGYLGLAGVIALSIVGIVKALDRAEWRMPVAADLADRLQL
jgi:uncharacterized membrane protein